MIKKYFEFIGESNNLIDGISIGEWIENASKGNQYLLNIISGYTQEIDPTIRLANAINLLSEENQKFLLSEVQEYFERGEDDGKKVDAIAYTSVDLNENNGSMGGKNLFKSFLKILTALGQKDSVILDWDKTPQNYLMVFKTDILNILEVKSVMSRYEFFNNFINQIEYTHNECKLFYALSNDLTVEYGVLCDGQKVNFGVFRMTKGMINWLMTIDSSSITPLKKILVGVGYDKLLLMSKIKSDMKDFFPGSSQSKSTPRIKDDIITFGFHGLGRWDNGTFDEGELENCKQNFRNYIQKFKWAQNVLMSVDWDQFWVYFNIKLK